MNAYHRVREGIARIEPDRDRARETFRPLALPALAAAMQVSGAALRAGRGEIALPAAARIVYEDEPEADPQP